MKFFLIIMLFAAGGAFAECDIEPLKEEIISQYKFIIPVKNEKGEIGHAKAKNFAVSDYIMKMKTEHFLLANFDLDIKWLKGHKQVVKSLIVATINPTTCTIDSYENGNAFGTAVANKK